MYYVIKIIITVILIIAFTEIAKKSNFWAAVLISLPIMSVIALCWTYYENKDVQQIITLSREILILVIPSLLFFLTLPLLLKYNINFLISVIAACGITAIAYYFVSITVKKLGIT